MVQKKRSDYLPRISFYGAAGTVTGSRYLLEANGQRVLVDCGLFQGYKFLREKNWLPFPVEAASIDAVLLTHAHLDHSGYLPVLVDQGFKGPVFCTAATRDLCEILLRDAAKIQEEEAEFRNRHRLSKHAPAKPLYTLAMAERALGLFEVVEEQGTASYGDMQATFHPNGHILGSTYLDVKIAGKHVLFSGDLGRPSDLIMYPPEPPCYCDYLVLESTYGDRTHSQRDLQTAVADIISETLAQGGSLLIPAFAVGRAQAMIYLVQQLRQEGRIPYVPIYLDSPMAISATEVMQRHPDLHRLNRKQCQELSREVFFLRTVEESMGLNHIQVPVIIIAASGMATGGRVLHHLKRMVGDHRNTVLFAGFQAGGTRGAHLVAGAPKVKIHGRYYDVKARVENLDFLSAHADRDEILRWLKKIPAAPKHCYITHGEPEASDQLRLLLQEELGWSASTPQMGDTQVLL
ncbi:MAG: MBL fold metallo-hydrolase [Pseudomonadales bacterium]|jgi:metallo-beta-lactamase family protein